MCINLTPYSTAIGVENIYFFTPHFKYFKEGKISDDNLLETNDSSVGPFYYHISQCGKDSFKKLRAYKIHSSFN